MTESPYAVHFEAAAQSMARPHCSLQNRASVLFVSIGVGALRLLHKDVGDVLQGIADHLRFNPEPKLVRFILEKAELVDDRLLRRIGAIVFVYAGLDLIEGIGLYLKRIWAEYLPWPSHRPSCR